MHLGTSAQQWQDFNDQQRFAHLEKLCNHFLLYIKSWAKSIDLAPEKIVFDQAIYDDVIEHYYKDLARMRDDIESADDEPANPDDFKQKAIYAFWLRRLRPLSLKEPISIAGLLPHWINEIIAIYIILIELDIIFEKEIGMVGSADGLSDKLHYDLLRFFRYKSVSPHALYLILASLYKYPVFCKGHLG